MADYTVRVELHAPLSDSYTKLHDAMERAGFRRWTVGQDGKRYSLPTAEYQLMGSALTTDKVRDMAHAVAKSVKPAPDPFVLVTKIADQAFWLPAA